MMKISGLATSQRAPILVLIGGLLVTGLAFTYFQWEADREAQEHFDQRSRRFAQKVEICLQEAVSASRSIRAVAESGASGDAKSLHALTRLGGDGPLAIAEIRWIAFLAPADSAASATPSFALIDVVAAGSGAPAFERGRIGAPPEFAKALSRTWRTGKPTLYMPEDEQGIGAPVHLSAINHGLRAAHQSRPLVLAVALNTDELIDGGLPEFLARKNRPPMDTYAIRVVAAPDDEPDTRERLLFETAAAQGQAPALQGGVAHGRSWLEHRSEAQLDGTRFHITAAAARQQIDAPEDAIVWWALALGLSATLLLALTLTRTAKARDIAEDISRKLGNQVRSSEARFRNLVDSTRDWMWETDAAGAISFTSGRVHALLGVTPREILGKRGIEFGFGLDLERASATAGRVELAAMHSSGREVWLQCACSRFNDEQGNLAGYRGVCSDITEARRSANRQRGLELELNRMDKVGTLDHVMSMVAHELNQPLAAISSYCGASVRMLSENPAPLEDVISSLKAAGTQAQAAAAVVRGIRQFIVRQEPNIASLRVEDLIGSARTLAAFRLNQARVQMESRLDTNLPSVLADEILIVQVLLNLLHNAVDAVAEVANPRIRIGARLPEEGWVHISVEDNGPGMSDEELARCFEPYVTSKATGLGLGLSISQAIVESHGGVLTLVRNARGGCTAAIRLKADQSEDESRDANMLLSRRGH